VGRSWPSQAQRAREGAGLAATQVEETARAREERTSSLRAHMSASAEGGGTAPWFDGAGELAARGGRNPAAGGLGGDSPPVAWFLVKRGGALARGGAGEPRGGLNLAIGGREGAVRGEVAELRDGDRRRWASGEGLGRGSGVLSSRQCDEAGRPT
jgi:hypothetical protein